MAIPIAATQALSSSQAAAESRLASSFLASSSGTPPCHAWPRGARLGWGRDQAALHSFREEGVGAGWVRCEAGAQAPISAAVVAPLKEEQQLGAPSSFEYNQLMKRRMANPYEYHHELGMCYTRITRHIILGSQPQSPDDVSMLKEKEGVGAILNMQEDKDAEYWDVDLPAVQRRSQDLGVSYYRRPAVDFDPNSLRKSLPGMVAVIARCVAEGKTVYVHCTAGLGRSPAAIIAYLFWFADPKLDLQKAYDWVTSMRPCGPKWEAIRAATYDLAKNSPYQPPLEQLPSFAFSDVADWERELIQERVRNCQV